VDQSGAVVFEGDRAKPRGGATPAAAARDAPR
jgi:hypothetical protein